MNFNAPLQQGKQPRYHEGSDLRSVRDSDVNSRLHSKARVGQRQSDNLNQSVALLHKQLAGLRRRVVGDISESVFVWQEPYKELDPSVFVEEGTLVYISPNNDLVTTGLTDPTGGAGTKSYPGIWLAVQNVPASDGTNYNVPQTDYPGATGTPSGTPLKGDLDGAGVFWVLICPTCGL